MKTKKIKISDLKPGMKIKSYDEKTNEIVFSNVNKIWKTNVPKESQRHLTFTNGSELKCSFNHPIMVMENNKIKEVFPDELKETDAVIDDNGITFLESIYHDDIDTNFIDLEVEGTETFFAQMNENSNMILTHNCNQGGIRNSSATFNFQFWHYEFEDLIVLKNNKGTDETRNRAVDYTVQLNRLAYQRLIDGKDITFFSPSDVPGLYEAFFADQNEFERLYAKYEKDKSIRKKTMPASEMFSKIMTERKETGRIYIMNVDHANDYGYLDASKAPIMMHNLCAEVIQHTKPMQNINDPLSFKKLVRMTKEDHKKYLEWKKNNPEKYLTAPK